MSRTDHQANRQESKQSEKRKHAALQASTPEENIRREEESRKKENLSPGSWSPPRAISRGEAKPLHHVKVARHRRGKKGSAVGPPPALAPRAMAHPSVTPRQLVTYDTS